MVETTSHINPQNSNHKRVECIICHYRVNKFNEAVFANFKSNVRAFQHESFKVWRCPNCKTIHTFDVVDIARYYKKYPIGQKPLTWPIRLCFWNLSRQLKKYGFSQSDSFLDYGYANGWFATYLQQRGFTNCHGYDPYATTAEFGDRAILDLAPFKYILLQDVIEHVEDPDALLSQLDHLLAPGGYILIGTPNATRIDLSQPHVSEYYNPIHVPYHFHIYTRQVIEYLGICQEWEPIDYFDRAYHDTPWFGVNTRSWSHYQCLFDGSLDAIYDPIDLRKVFSSQTVMFYAFFGYWLSLRTDMSVMFRKL